MSVAPRDVVSTLTSISQSPPELPGQGGPDKAADLVAATPGVSGVGAVGPSHAAIAATTAKKTARIAGEILMSDWSPASGSGMGLLGPIVWSVTAGVT